MMGEWEVHGAPVAGAPYLPASARPLFGTRHRAHFFDPAVAKEN